MGTVPTACAHWDAGSNLACVKYRVYRPHSPVKGKVPPKYCILIFTFPVFWHDIFPAGFLRLARTERLTAHQRKKFLWEEKKKKTGPESRPSSSNSSQSGCRRSTHILFEQLMSNLKCDNISKLSPHVANDFPTTKDLSLIASNSLIRITYPEEIKDESREGREVWGSVRLDNRRTFSNTCSHPHLSSCRYWTFREREKKRRSL